ncbi:MAG: hypothetical protein A2W25_07090 [candidate division Zixibacteria bacterium RBG_16_53_22]|nr:MAG: hypothetical protein A2W25_07090 [candidate division Zixibacteria bacterium RBG_16_53_22]
MLWILMLLAVGVCGILGFYDSLYGFGELMRMINSGILILLSLGLLLRTWVKKNLGKTEKLMERNLELEKRVEELCRLANNQKREATPSHHSSL